MGACTTKEKEENRIKELKRNADNGNPESCYELADLYMRGYNVCTNIWGNLEIMTDVEAISLDLQEPVQKIIPKDTDIALKYLTIASRHGYKKAIELKKTLEII